MVLRKYGVGLDRYHIEDVCIGMKDFNNSKYSFHFIESLHWLVVQVEHG